VEDQGRGVGVAVIKKSSIANNGRAVRLDWDGLGDAKLLRLLLLTAGATAACIADRRWNAGWLTFRCTVRQLVLELPLRLPPNFRDVTAERVGTMVAIVGATAAEKAKPK
jgi:hypothetical protein